MKTKILYFILSLISLSLYSQQPQQQVWYLQNQSVDFRGTSPTLNQVLNGFPTTSFIPGSSVNGVHNSVGDLLFYVAGDQVIGKLGNFIGQLATFGIQNHGEMAIIPVQLLLVNIILLLEMFLMVLPVI